jgi:hypothetical protein
MTRYLSMAGLGALTRPSTGVPLQWARESIRGRAESSLIRPGKSDAARVVFNPSPSSLMCAGMSFSVSLFYPNVSLSSTVMAAALQHLVDEVPILAGRTARETSSLIHRFSDHVIVVRPAGGVGFSFRTEAREHRTLRQAVDAIWRNNEPLRLHTRRTAAHTIEPIRLGKTEDDELAHVDLVRYADGAVLSLHVSHILADAGRATKLLERLSVIYEAIQNDKPIPRGTITCDSWFDAALNEAESRSPHCPTARAASAAPTANDMLRLSPSRILEFVRAFHSYTTTRFVPLHIYVPRDAVTAMLARAASGGKQNPDNDVECRDHATLAAPSWIPLNSSPVTLSKMDIVQALAVTMIRRARPEMDGEINVVINMDLSMIYPPLRPKDDSRRTPPSDILGNSSVFLQIRGTDFHPHDVVHNARLLRRAINEFRANARGNVSAALRKTAAMSSLPKTAVHAAFILHGTREKLASCTAVASFPVDTISFEGVAPAFHWVDSHVGFDWWSIVSRVSGELTPGMDGWVVTMNVPEAARDRIAGYMKLQQEFVFRACL